MMSMVEENLVFADTFDHQSDPFPQGEKCDVIQFSYPVCVSRVSVVPSGESVVYNHQHQLAGLTSPGFFKLEVFCHDVKTAQSCTRFSKLCEVHYDNAFNNHTTVVNKPLCVTDLLVIKGKYDVISLCVFASVSPFTLPTPPPVPLNEKVPHLSGEATLASASSDEKLPTTPTALQLPTSLMNPNNNNSKVSPTKNREMFPSKETPTGDQSQYLPPVDVTVPPPAMGDNSLFNPQLPDAIPFAPPMKTPTTPIELISAPNNSAAAADNLQKATADFETNNIAKELVDMRRDRTVPRIDNHSSRDDVVPKSESTSASNSGDTDENDKWLAAANLFLQQAAESAAADRAGISTQSGSGPTSSEQKFQELLSMAEKISPQGVPKTSEHKSSPPTELPSPLNDVAPPPHSAADTLGPPPVPFSAHQVPGVPPGPPNAAMPPNLPPGLNLNPAVAMAALAGARFPFPAPPFNMAMPPFFNPALLEQMSKLYTGPAIMSASNMGTGMGPPPGSMPPGAPGLPNPQKMTVGHIPGMSGPPLTGGMSVRAPPSVSTMVTDGVGSGINVQLTSDPLGSQSSQTDTAASSTAEDYDDLSHDEDSEEDYEDLSDEEYEIDEEGFPPTSAVPASAISAAVNIKIEAQIGLEKEEDLLLEAVLKKHSQSLWPEEAEDTWTGDMKEHQMKHFLSPHLFISERLQNADGVTKDIDKNKMKSFLEVLTELQKRESGQGTEWIDQLESLFHLALEGLTWLKSKGFEKFRKTVKEMVAYTIMAIDWETALGQDAGDNVRQLKVGCRLTTLLAHFSIESLQELLNANVFDNLFKLINQPLMLSAMQMYVLEAINALCCSSVGVRNLLVSDGFARLLTILQTSRCIRINHAVSVIAHKINIFENLQSCLKQSREVIRKIRNSASVETPCNVDSEGVAQSFVELMDSLIEYPKNTLSTPGNIKKFSPQPYEDFMFRMMHEKELLEQMLTLLASPLLQPSNKLTATLFKLLDWLLSSTNGRSFMFYKRETYLEFISCMKKASELDLECEKFKSLETRMKVALKTTISVDKLKGVTSSLELDGSHEAEPAGMRDCFEKIYVLTTKDCETVCEILKQTDMLNFMSRFVGNAYIKKGPEKNSNPVVESKVSKSKENEDNSSSTAEQTIKTCTNVDSKHGEHPIAFFGVCILLKAAQMHDSDIENWAFPLLNLPEVEESQAALRVSGSTSVININVQSTRMIELKRWLEPLRDLKAAVNAAAAAGSKQTNSELTPMEFSKVTLNHIPHLVDFFKYRTEDFGPRMLAEAPGFITCIRVLMRLLKPHQSKFMEPKVNLSAVVRLFESAGYEIILKLISKGVCESSNCYMWQSHQLMSRLPEETVESCFKLVVPLLQLLKLMIDQIASAADFHFRDMRVIKALLPLHAVLCSRFRLQNKFRGHMGQVQTLIAEIFLIYAKKVSEDPEPGVAGKKEFDEENEKEEQDPESDDFVEGSDEKTGQTSLGWELMLKEVLSHIMKLPNCALSGLCLLSELLPLPLPMMSPAALEENELTRIRENRSDWADHLLLHKNLIQEMFSQFTNSASSSLGNMLRRVAWQIADLNPELAKIVICCFLDNVNELMGDDTCIWQPKVSQKLQFLDHAVSQPAGKAALMEMLMEDQSLEAVDNQRVLPCFEKLLSMLEMEAPEPKSPPNHESILYYIITILQSLCDPSVSLLPFDPSETYIPTHLVCCNTPPEQMTSRICKVLLKHASGSMHSMFTFHHALKAVILLCCHDMVFIVVKKYLMSNSETLKSLLKRLHKEPKTQRNEDNLRVFISFINLLRGSNLSEDFLGSDRTIFLSTNELLPLLSAGTDFEYSLEKYSEKLIREGVKLSGAAEDCLKGLLQYLSSANHGSGLPNRGVVVNGMTPSVNEPKVSLLEQFEKRSVYRISPIDDDRFSPSNWFATCTDEIARDLLVTVDLSEICKESLHDFDPIVEFRKAKEAEIQRSSRKHKYHQRRYAPLVCKGMKRTGREIVRRPNYLAKEKGVELGPKRSDDVFRLRKQNTSRPPSMHVDDYMMLEKAHNDSPSAVPGTVPRRKSRLSGTEPGKASPEARKRSRLCDSPSESSQTRRPILPIVAGSVGATGTVASTPNSGRQLNAAGANGKMMNIPSEMSCFPGGNESPPGDSNERAENRSSSSSRRASSSSTAVCDSVVNSSQLNWMYQYYSFYSAARGWINNVSTDNTRGRTGLSKPNQPSF